MPSLIEDYAIIGNCETIALVGRDGSIDWLGLPRFDSAACFSALLGNPSHGRWLIGPTEKEARVTRRYRGDTLVLETDFETDAGAISVIDFIARRDGISDVVRLVRGIRGKVSMRTELVVRFEYGSVVPWVARQEDGRLQFAAGPDRLLLDTPIPLVGEDWRTVGAFDVSAGEEDQLYPELDAVVSPSAAAHTCDRRARRGRSLLAGLEGPHSRRPANGPKRCFDRC